jgi:polysaccharide biosynthesis protein PslH
VTAVLRRAQPPDSWWVPRPHEHDEFSSPALNALVQQTLQQGAFDAVQVEFVQMAQHVPPGLPILKVLTEHEVVFASCHAALKGESRPLQKAWKLYEWLVQLNYEARVCRQFDRVACMTDEDRTTLSRFVSPERLRTVPIGVDSGYFDPQQIPTPGKSPLQMVFVGNYRHPPNRDAVYFFAKKILPRIRAEVPGAEFCVVGGNSHLLEARRLEAAEGVRVVGYVGDVRSCYRSAAVFVAPILTGSGMRVKLLEALSMGMAVVATPLAARGFRTRGEGALLVADDRESFASQTLRVLQNEALRNDLGARARAMILEHFDWRIVESKFLDLVENGHD